MLYQLSYASPNSLALCCLKTLKRLQNNPPQDQSLAWEAPRGKPFCCGGMEDYTRSPDACGEANCRGADSWREAASIYDGKAPDVLTQQQMELYWTGKLPKIDHPGSMPFGQWQCRMKPGNGVFNPACFPHGL